MELTIHRGARAVAAGRGRTALCLCGGGITGAMFEVGVLAALDDLSGAPISNQFDLYVGASAGASIATLVAQGIPAARLFDALRDPEDPYFRLRRTDVYGFEMGPWLRAFAQVAWDAARAVVPGRRGGGWPSPLERMPPGVFRLGRYRAFLAAFFAREHLARTFAAGRAELYVVANDVDSAARVVFGDAGFRDVAVADAIAASSAIPLFFEPVRIGGRDYFDGGIGRVAHIDVAIDRGAERIVVINPVVPIQNLGPRRLRDQGLMPVFNQAMRIMNKARLHFGIKRYLAEHPTVEVTVIEPSDDETVLAAHGSMGVRGRVEILDYARRAALAALAPDGLAHLARV